MYNCVTCTTWTKTNLFQREYNALCLQLYCLVSRGKFSWHLGTKKAEASERVSERVNKQEVGKRERAGKTRTNEDIFINGTIKTALKQYDSSAVIQKKQQPTEQKWEQQQRQCYDKNDCMTKGNRKERENRGKKYEYVFL